MCLTLVSDHLDGELSFAQQSELFLHLGSCSSCRKDYNSWLLLREGFRNDRIQVSSQMDEEFFNKLDEKKRSLRKLERPSLTRHGIASRFGSYALVSLFAALFTLMTTLLLLDNPGQPYYTDPTPIYSEIPKSAVYILPEVTVYLDETVEKEL